MSDLLSRLEKATGADREKCPECGGASAVMISTGGPCIYWRVECLACGFNTRGPGVMHGLAPLGFGPSQYAPQNSRKEALERWSQLCSKAALAKATEEKPQP